MHARALVAVALVVASLWAGAGARAVDDRGEYLVEAPGGALAARGFALVDDYGGFATARLSAAQAAALAREGVALFPLSHALGRNGVDAATAEAALSAPADSPLQVVQFRGPVRAEWRDALGEVALAVYDYLPEHAFLVRLPPGAAERLAAMPEVRAVEPYHPAWKLSPGLHAEGERRVSVLVFPDEPLALALASIVATGALPMDATRAPLEHVVDALATPEEVRALARLPAVAWIEPAHDEASTDNAMASAITQGGASGAWPLHEKGIDGSSQVVSVCDTGVNANAVIHSSLADTNVLRMTHEAHDDPAQPFVVWNAHRLPTLPLAHRKIDLYYAPHENNRTRGDFDDLHGHGTHTAGTLAGDAPPYGERNLHDGLAPAARLVVCDVTTDFSFHVLNDYANYWDPAYERGARVNSNSWGSSHTGAYTEKARQHDHYVWENRDFVILRSMGNVADAIRPEAVAKSALGIGATGNGADADEVASFSGSGPTQDGRVKPNVVAPGHCLTSSYRDFATSYACLSGTSMSTPAVAGAAALVRDYFAKGYYPSGAANASDAREASSALVRAVLQVSGREVGGDRGEAGFPNPVQGWGRVTLDDALFFAGEARGLRVLTDEGAPLATGDTYAATLQVSAGEPLRIMLAWSDYPGAAGADPALVNDLDLRVVDPTGATLGARDARNVEEAVYVESPLAGAYVVQVTGVNVPQGPQPFALVATGALS